MLNKMELVNPAYIEAADRLPNIRGRRWIKWGSAAACLGLAAACSAFIFLHPNIEENPFTTENIEDISALSSAYGSTLLAENLVLSDAENATIQLRCKEGGDISDTSSWDTLSVTAEYVGCNVMLNCSFHAFENTGILEPPSEIIPYRDFQVFLYREEPTEYCEYIYRALFEYGGITYDLSTQSNHPQDIYELLDIVIGASPAADTPDSQDSSETSDMVDSVSPIIDERPFSDILGYENYRISVEESTPYFYIWYYYAEIDGEMQCVADTSAGSWHPGVYSVDLDGDGISEFITNTEYGDGAERVQIYRNHDGIIETSGLNERYLYDKYYISFDGAVWAVVTKFDPQENVFVITGPSRFGGTITINISYDEQEAFSFLPYTPLLD
ncbi:MAG: hypothetical protein K2H45_11535 [Acetatifactor sp.]|nr:hypothetical protein [Acetatifactor sp.]